MVFSSLIFLFFFLPAALFCYYIVPQKFIRVRNAVLLLFSLFFYFYGEPRLIGMLIFSILMNYLFGLSMRSTYRKPLLILCVIANLSLLGVFKYLNFFISTADSLFGLGIPVTGIVMPIGISFYTFQALSYVIDVYRREVPPQHDPFSLALYVSMFPQLIAGPIVRYHDVNVQLAVRKHSFAQFSEGISRFLFGLSKKVLLSNVFAQIADGVFKYAPSELSAAGAWMGAIGYTLQIYFDFSGYSDMAIGLGKMFGFAFLENFNYPYISKSVTEFWRRWHISLSSWLRDYLYISLGGNRKGKIRQYANLIITMFLGGLWHGASWNFVFWGMLHGVALAAHKFWMGITGRKKGERSHGIRRFFGIVITFHFVCFCWIFFRNADFSTSLDMLNQIFTAFRPRLFTQLVEGYWEVFALMSLGFFLHFVPDSWEHACCKAVIRLPLIGKALLLVAMIYLVIQMKSSEIQPFIYFQF